MHRLLIFFISLVLLCQKSTHIKVLANTISPHPSENPSKLPSQLPSSEQLQQYSSTYPSQTPSDKPNEIPSEIPSKVAYPSIVSIEPSHVPSIEPSIVPSLRNSSYLPTMMITSRKPSVMPSRFPSAIPSSSTISSTTPPSTNQLLFQPWSFVVFADWHGAEQFAVYPLTGNVTDTSSFITTENYDGYPNYLRVLKHIYDIYGGDLAILPGDSNVGKWQKKAFLRKLRREGGLKGIGWREAIEVAGENCYSTMKRLFAEGGYNVSLMCIGDHELGGTLILTKVISFEYLTKKEKKIVTK